MAGFGKRRRDDDDYRPPNRSAVPSETPAPQRAVCGQRSVAGLGPVRVTGAAAGSINVGLRSYLLSVYQLMMLGVAMSGAVALLIISGPESISDLTDEPLFPITIFLGVLGLSFFSGAIAKSGSPLLGHLFFWPYCILWGAGLAPMLNYMIEAGHPDVIARAFFLAASLFAAATVYGYSTKTDLSGIGCALVMLCWGLFAATIMNCFVFQTSGFGMFLCYATVIIFTAVTAWETQEIKDMYTDADSRNQTDAKAIGGAFQLYGSFMMIFSRLLRIFWSVQQG